jgi:positive regulator of sigma E activity
MSFECFLEVCAMSAFMLYVFGFIVLLAGLIYGAVLIQIPQTWIVVGALVMIGLGVMSAVSHTKRRDPPAEAPPTPDV